MSDLAGKIPDIPQPILNEIDFVLIAGDVTLGARSVDRAAKNFDKLGAFLPKDRSVFFIPGNHDFPILAEDQPFYPPNFIQMHNRVYFYQVESMANKFQVRIIGFGGAKIGLYNNFAFSEDKIYASLKDLFQKPQQNMNNLPIITILLVHDPPNNTSLDLNYQKNHVGSESVRRIIEEFQPHLAVAGHIHESPAVERIGKTVAVNAGEAKYNKFAEILLDFSASSADPIIDINLH